MAQLPVGTKAAAAFAEAVIIKGFNAAAVAVFPGLMGTWLIGSVIGNILDAVIKKYLAHPGVDEQTKYALAAVYAISRTAFDKRFIYLKTLDKQGLTPAQVERELTLAEDDMGVFVKRGPIK